ncbi:MAG: hypothetical protein J7K29_03005 [Candidatus Cloacimonetes bacterium]|nr:hypothetical protein [Candidatus Cloacimonadota bacterium]
MNIEEEKERLNKLYNKTETIPPEKPRVQQQPFPQQQYYPPQPTYPVQQPIYPPQYPRELDYGRSSNLRDILKLADRIEENKRINQKWFKIIAALVFLVILLILISTNMLPLG